MDEFPKISIRMKNFKILEVPNSHCSERNFSTPSPPPPEIFDRRFTGIYRHLLSKFSKNAVLERLKMVLCKCCIKAMYKNKGNVFILLGFFGFF